MALRITTVTLALWIQLLSNLWTAFASGTIILADYGSPGQYSWQVPGGVLTIQVKLWGAGGSGRATSRSSPVDYAGGSGGFTVCYLAVTPGQLLYIIVGGGGVSSGLGAYSTGGYGGGAFGKPAGDYFVSGGGGGRSAIQLIYGTDAATAGGGGGGGANGYGNSYYSDEGTCGGDPTGCLPSSSSLSGSPGTQSISSSGGLQYQGASGSGGGGGGGYFGGGSGANGASGTYNQGGGGGGSGYIGGCIAGTNSTTVQGYSGNPSGSITIAGGHLDPNYVDGVGVGGYGAYSSGGNGRVIIFRVVNPTSQSTSQSTSANYADGVGVGGYGAYSSGVNGLVTFLSVANPTSQPTDQPADQPTPRPSSHPTLRPTNSQVTWSTHHFNASRDIFNSSESVALSLKAAKVLILAAPLLGSVAIGGSIASVGGFTQSVGTYQPTLDLTADGHPCIKAVANQGNAYSSGQYLSVPSLTLKVWSNRGFTIATRFRFDSSADFARVFDFGNGAGNQNIFLASLGSHQLSFGIFLDNNVQTRFKSVNPVITIGEWTVYIITVDLSNRGAIMPYLYVNGVLQPMVCDVCIGQQITSGGSIVETAKWISISDRTTSNNYIFKSNWGDPYQNGALTAFIVYDYFLNYNSTMRLNNFLNTAYYPTSQPSVQPSPQPSNNPTRQPVMHPSRRPSDQPASKPTMQPNTKPSGVPSHRPSNHPSKQPTSQPSNIPSSQPTRCPSKQPTALPTLEPSNHPTTQPSRLPSGHPSSDPSAQPSTFPSYQPTMIPSLQPTREPSLQPRSTPTTQPGAVPSIQPSTHPTEQPTRSPSAIPSTQPSSRPSKQPFSRPTDLPVNKPSTQPSIQPTSYPTTPTTQPTSTPSSQPAARPSLQPITDPSNRPTDQPTGQPQANPSSQPAAYPSPQPTHQPSRQPSRQPICCPSTILSQAPTHQPTKQPSIQPTYRPSLQPYSFPTSQPTIVPSRQPSRYPTRQPSEVPSTRPSTKPSRQPTTLPSSQPSVTPSRQPSSQPTTSPTAQQSVKPSQAPTSQPRNIPTSQPYSNPSIQPTYQPYSLPTCQPSSIPTQSELVWTIVVDNATDAEVDIMLVDQLCVEATWISQTPTGRCSLRAAILYCVYRVPWLLGRIKSCEININSWNVNRTSLLTTGEITVPSLVLLCYDGANSNANMCNRGVSSDDMYLIVVRGNGLIIHGGSGDSRSSTPQRLLATNVSYIYEDQLLDSNGVPYGSLLELIKGKGSPVNSALISHSTKRELLMGLVIREATFVGNPRGDGGCIFIADMASVVMDSIVIVGCGDTAMNAIAGGGLSLSSVRNIAIVNSSVSGCSATDGGGVAIMLSNNVVIENTIIAGNTAKGVGGGLLIHGATAVYLCDVHIVGNVVLSNGFGAGISACKVVELTIIQCSITANVADFGSAVAFDSSKSPWIANNTISNNVAIRGGTIFWLSKGHPPNGIEFNDFIGNIVRYYGPKVATETTGIVASINVVHVVQYGSDPHPVAFDISLADYYRQYVTSENNTIVTSMIEPGKVSCSYNDNKATLVGQTIVTTVDGKARFRSLGATQCIPGGYVNVTLSAIINSYSAQYPLYGSNALLALVNTTVQSHLRSAIATKSLDISFRFRHCHRGEIFDFDLTRTSCTLCMDSYSVAANDDNLVTKCQKCPQGATYCQGTLIDLAQGTWRWSEYAATVLPCITMPNGCKGGNTTGESSCYRGYEGALCSRCSKGYFKTSSKCEICDGRQWLSSEQVTFYVLVTAATAVICRYLAKWMIGEPLTKMESKIEGPTAGGSGESLVGDDPASADASADAEKKLIDPSFQIRAKMLIIALQVIIANAASFSSLPPLFSSLISSCNFLDLDVAAALPFRCTSWSPDFFVKLVITTMFPLGIGLVLFVGYIIEWLLYLYRQSRAAVCDVTTDKRKHLLLKMKYSSIALLISFFLLPNVSVAIFQSFNCVDMDPNRDDPANELHVYLRRDPTINCNSEYYLSWMPFVYTVACIYPIGFPVLYFYLLATHRHDIELISLVPVLNEATMLRGRRERSELNQNLSAFGSVSKVEPRFVHCLALFYYGYKPKYWYWELIDIGRRLLSSCIISVFLGGTKAQLILLILLSLLFILATYRLKPFTVNEDNVFAELCHWQVMLTSYLLSIINQDSLLVLGSSEDYVIDRMIVIVNIAVFVALVYLSVIPNVDLGFRYNTFRVIRFLSRNVHIHKNGSSEQFEYLQTAEAAIDSTTGTAETQVNPQVYLQFAHVSTRIKFLRYLSTLSNLALYEMQSMIVTEIRIRIGSVLKQEVRNVRHRRSLSIRDSTIGNEARPAIIDADSLDIGRFGYFIYLPISTASEAKPVYDRVDWDRYRHQQISLPVIELDIQDLNYVRFVTPVDDSPLAPLINIPDDAFWKENYAGSSIINGTADCEQRATADSVDLQSEWDDPVMRLMVNISNGIPPPPQQQSAYSIASAHGDGFNDEATHITTAYGFIALNSNPLSKWDTSTIKSAIFGDGSKALPANTNPIGGVVEESTNLLDNTEDDQMFLYNTT